MPTLMALVLLALIAMLAHDESERHREVCALRFAAAPTSRDTLAVIRADDFCTRLVRDTVVQ